MIEDEITITIDEAIQIVLINNYMIRKGILNIELAEAQIREAWGHSIQAGNINGIDNYFGFSASDIWDQYRFC